VHGDGDEPLVMKLALAVCSARDWKHQFGLSLAGLIASVFTNGIDGKELEAFDLITRGNCSNISNGRHSILNECVERGFTHVLMLDDDMTFLPDLANRLAQHDADIVSINYSHKSPETTGMVLGMDGQYVTARTGAVRVLRVGFGAILIKLELVKKLSKPFFEMCWSDHHKMIVGEDYYFCDKMVKAGAKIVCDLDVIAGHIGDFEYLLDRPKHEDQRPVPKRPEEAA
jgi:hypothetical protein